MIFDIYIKKKGKANVTEITCWSENNLQPLVVFVVRKHFSQRAHHEAAFNLRIAQH